jgi:glutamate synthase (NADPH/NADH) small chain
VLFAGGAEEPRDPKLPGMDLAGVYYAMPYLVQQNRRTGGEGVSNEPPILADGKHVVVIGGGDTASDCVGTAFRQGALSVTQLDIRPKPPEREDKLSVWPYLADQDAHVVKPGRGRRARVPSGDIAHRG